MAATLPRDMTCTCMVLGREALGPQPRPAPSCSGAVTRTCRIRHVNRREQPACGFPSHLMSKQERLLIRAFPKLQHILGGMGVYRTAALLGA